MASKSAASSGKQPAPADASIDDLVQPRRAPGAHLARPQRDSVGDCRDPLASAHEDVASHQPKGACGKPSAALHIVQYLSYADVHPGKGVVTGYGPPDVASQEVRKTTAVTARVVLVLRTVQPVE